MPEFPDKVIEQNYLSKLAVVKSARGLNVFSETERELELAETRKNGLEKAQNLGR